MSPESPHRSTPRPARLAPEEAAAYWEARHRGHTDLRSGGHLGLDEAGNEMFYARRLGTLLDIVGDTSNPAAPLFALDAGCGKGHFAHALARCGHRVDAVDASPYAIERCLRRETPPGRHPPRFVVARLTQWEAPYLYDLVYAIDVLFHILDDGEWRRSLENLASLVRLAGTLVVTDREDREDHDNGHDRGAGSHRVQRGNYILHRGFGEYRRVLEPRGLAFREFRPYGFRENRVGFYVYTRVR